jgi:hypothetical protein
MLATAGTAAATPGNPVHRILFGQHTTQDPNNSANSLHQVEALLDQATNLVTAARARGYLTAQERAAAERLLNQARALLQPMPATPTKTHLTDRTAALASALASLAATPVTTPTQPTQRNSARPNSTHPSGSQPTASSGQNANSTGQSNQPGSSTGQDGNSTGQSDQPGASTGQYDNSAGQSDQPGASTGQDANGAANPSTNRTG